MTIKWENNVVPIAKRVFKLRFATISRLAFYTITSLAGVGIVLSLMFLAFNLHFRKLKWVCWQPVTVNARLIKIYSFIQNFFLSQIDKAFKLQTFQHHRRWLYPCVYGRNSARLGSLHPSII
jgi:hypothetical protein